MKRALVTGAGGFIGGHLCAYLKSKGYWVRGVDIKPPEFRTLDSGWIDEFKQADLRVYPAFSLICDVDEVYNLAANMGGMGHISKHYAQIFADNMKIDLNMLHGAKGCKNLERYFYSSSACVYREELQERPDIAGLRESDAYPAQPQDSYGYQKLMGEKLAEWYLNDYKVPTRVARFHNIFGERGTYEGGREKAPAAMCRKIATAKLTGNHEIEIWGDGEQTRSFCYVDDCVEGIYRITQHDQHVVLNLGSEHLVTINQLADMVADIAGITITKRHDLSKPQGVRGRNSDNTLLRKTIGWEPSISLRSGLEKTYAWVESQVEAQLKAA